MAGKSLMSVAEARKILGDDADTMTDDEISEVIASMSIIAVHALEKARHEILVKRDARRLAELVYDIYLEKKESKGAQA